MRRELIAASLATLLGCNPVFAQVAGIGSPMPGMGVTSPFGMGSAAGSVGPTGVPLGATELATPGLSPAPPSTLGSGFTVCSAVVGAPSTAATGLYDGGGLGTATGMSPMAMGTTSAASASTCNQAIRFKQPRYFVVEQHTAQLERAAWHRHNSDGLDRARQCRRQPNAVSLERAHFANQRQHQCAGRLLKALTGG